MFSQHWWLDAVCTDWDIAIAHKGERLTGVWAYHKAKKAGVNIIRTPRLTPYLGPQVFIPSDVKESSRDSFEYDTIAELIKQIPNEKVWNISLQPALKQVGLFKAHGLHTQVHQTFLIDVTQSEETLFANLKESLRRNIRAAEKELTITTDPAHLKHLFDFQKDTLERKDVLQAYTYDDMHRLFNACTAHKSGSLLAAIKDGEVQAVIWTVWDATCCYYFMGAKNPASENQHAMAALLWQAMKEAHARGNHTFDMEGSMDAGVERFFRGFGGKRELYLILKKNTSIRWRIKEMLKG